MSDSSSRDHWKDLADLIGAEVPDEPIVPEQQQEEKEVSPEEAPVEDPVAEEPAQKPLSEEPCEESEPVTAEVCNEPEPIADAEESTDENHWWSLAGELGIALPEPEPKPEPEPESSAEPVTHAFEPTEQPAPTDEFTLGESETAGSVDAVEMPTTESRDLVEEDDAPEPPQDDSYMPLFEDPGLSLETPGVLDAIFDEADAKAAVDDSEEPITSVEIEDEGREVDEEVQQVQPATDTEQERAAEAEEDSEEKPTKRRRRRRRRRPPRKDRDESGEAEEKPGAEAETPASEEDAVDSRQGPKEDRSEDEGKTEAAKLKHRKIPTWEEAIEIVISTNKEARSKSSGGPRGRRRGRK
jgi:ribonuclease E